MNQPALALLACQKVKSILREKSNYKRLSDIDLFESNCLILLSEQEEAQKKKNNPSLKLKIYADLNQYHEKTLTFERSELLQ